MILSFSTKEYSMQKYIRILLFIFPCSGFAQTITDGLMMQKKDLCTGFLYTHDRWTDYWEGDLKRDNENIGSLTTQSIMWVGTYGLTEKINVIAMLPYIKTETDQGTLHSMAGLQDLTLAIKYNFFKKDFPKSTLKTFGGLAVSTPISDYTPDFYPLSLGAASTNLSWRATTYYKFLKSFYVNGTAAYTWRSNVKLDRPSYYTNDQLYLTNEVKMPNVFDYSISFGYLKHGLQLDLSYMQQNTLGGSDIRRQDMPFVSNRMNFSKAGLLALYYLKKPSGLAVRGSIIHTLAGRNVGLSTTFMTGLLYTIHFNKI
jgi:hypothetical protein